MARNKKKETGNDRKIKEAAARELVEACVKFSSYESMKTWLDFQEQPENLRSHMYKEKLEEIKDTVFVAQEIAKLKENYESSGKKYSNVELLEIYNSAFAYPELDSMRSLEDNVNDLREMAGTHPEAKKVEKFKELARNTGLFKSIKIYMSGDRPLENLRGM